MSFNVLPLSSSTYPYNLKLIDTPPSVLFYKGAITSTTFSRCLSIVGSRSATKYGVDVLEHLFKTLDKSITIVSGFMTGIDSIAHKLALAYGMKTIAVLPCGIDLVHPKSNTALYNTFLHTDNLLLSEYSYKQPPFKWCYVKRNRLIAGLSLATLVVEASLNSGSLITANYSYAYKRPVLVVPGNIFSSTSKGCNYLLNTHGVGVSSGAEINKVIENSGFFI